MSLWDLVVCSPVTLLWWKNYSPAYPMETTSIEGEWVAVLTEWFPREVFMVPAPGNEFLFSEPFQTARKRSDKDIDPSYTRTLTVEDENRCCSTFILGGKGGPTFLPRHGLLYCCSNIRGQTSWSNAAENWKREVKPSTSLISPRRKTRLLLQATLGRVIVGTPSLGALTSLERLEHISWIEGGKTTVESSWKRQTLKCSKASGKKERFFHVDISCLVPLRVPEELGNEESGFF
ncbi:hypothetical protein VTO42DRAFT_7217 [Malbranchea cinnamomea]